MSNSHNILLVANESAETTSLSKILSGKGFAVTTASNGEDALWKLDHNAYDCLFVEAVLRGMSGLELAEEIHALDLKLPVVVIAEAASEAAPEGVSCVGVTEFLRKPLTPSQIADAAGRVLHLTEAELVQQSQMPAVELAPEPTGSTSIRRIKNIVLFVLAPFVGLVYLLSFPIVGIGMVVWATLKKKKQNSENAAGALPATPVQRSLLKTIAMVPAAFFIGVVFAVAGPILGIGVLLWFGFEAWGRVGAKAMSA